MLSSFHEFRSHPEFDFHGDPRVHLGLLPIPFLGNLGTADVFILLLNPGLTPMDYLAEERNPGYREALGANLRQETPEGLPDFFILAPDFAWHPGFSYWNGKLRELAKEAERQRGCSYAEALVWLGSRVAAVQLVPYHSSVSGLKGKERPRLQSAGLAVSYAREVLVPRAKADQATVVVGRAARHWGLEESENVIVYRGTESRGASFGLKSRGGRAIARRLGLAN